MVVESDGAPTGRFFVSITIAQMTYSEYCFSVRPEPIDRGNREALVCRPSAFLISNPCRTKERNTLH